MSGVSRSYAFAGIGAALVLSVAFAPRASAASGTLKIDTNPVFGGIAGGGEFDVTLFSQPGYYEPMAANAKVPGSDFQTFCIEKGASLAGVKPFQWQDAVQVNNGPGHISAETAYLFTKFWLGTLPLYDYPNVASPNRQNWAFHVNQAMWILEGQVAENPATVDAQTAFLLNLARTSVTNPVLWPYGPTGIGDVRVLVLTDANGVPLQDVLILKDPGLPPPPSGGSAYSPGYWHKASRYVGADPALYPFLSGLCLFNADGSNFDPTTGAQVAGWIQSNATNMAYKLSSMVCCGELNMLVPVGGKAYDGNTLVNTGAASVYFGGAAQVKFSVLIQAAIDDLCLPGHNYTPSQGPGSQFRAKQGALAGALDAVWI